MSEQTPQKQGPETNPWAPPEDWQPAADAPRPVVEGPVAGQPLEVAVSDTTQAEQASRHGAVTNTAAFDAALNQRFGQGIPIERIPPPPPRAG